MNTLKALAMMIVCATCITAAAAFAPPTQDQIKQAAADPAALAALLKGASPEQAAQVVKTVIVAALAMKLETSVQTARINQIIAAAVGAMSAHPSAFATALGTSLGGAAAINQNAGLVKTMRAALAAVGGQHGTALVTAFQTAFTAAAQATATPVDATDYGR